MFEGCVRGCVKGVWRVCEGCVKGVWRVCEGCVKGVLEGVDLHYKYNWERLGKIEGAFWRNYYKDEDKTDNQFKAMIFKNFDNDITIFSL